MTGRFAADGEGESAVLRQPDAGTKLVAVIHDPLSLLASKAANLKVEHGDGLDIAERESRCGLFARLVCIRCLADDLQKLLASFKHDGKRVEVLQSLEGLPARVVRVRAFALSHGPGSSHSTPRSA